jgi:RimJ/RimL family protein N-acetyltransferase
MSSSSSRLVIRTDRLQLRELVAADAVFILELVNEPSWLLHIGDKGVHSVEDAERYIALGPQTSYEQHGFGLYLVELTETATSLGICGLLKRETMDYPDLGFAFLPRHWGQGYAIESAVAVLEYAKKELRLERVAAITKVDNASSIRVLENLGMKVERRLRLTEDDDELLLFLTPC